MKRITVSLPDDLVERIKRAAGGEGQVSSYVATALVDYQEREGLEEILASWRSETPIAEDVGRQIAAELDEAGLTMSSRRGGSICIPAGVIAQAWCGPRQVRLARLIRSRDVDIAVMTLSVARTVGEICADVGHCDIVDVHVALCAREREHAVVTSDTDDLARVDPALPLIRV
jgi:hypothetical protein